MRFTPIKEVVVNPMLYDRISVTIYLGKDDTDVAEEFNNLKSGKTYVLDELEQKKTLSQVGYAWLLIGRLANKLNIANNDAYREYIRRFDNYTIEVFPKPVAQKYARLWEQQGTGWQTEIASEQDGDVELICYKGISKWSRKELSELIEMIKEDCRDLRIPTER